MIKIPIDLGIIRFARILEWIRIRVVDTIRFKSGEYIESHMIEDGHASDFQLTSAHGDHPSKKRNINRAQFRADRFKSFFDRIDTDRTLAIIFNFLMLRLPFLPSATETHFREKSLCIALFILRFVES